MKQHKKKKDIPYALDNGGMSMQGRCIRNRHRHRRRKLWRRKLYIFFGFEYFNNVRKEAYMLEKGKME